MEQMNLMSKKILVFLCVISQVTFVSNAYSYSETTQNLNYENAQTSFSTEEQSADLSEIVTDQDIEEVKPEAIQAYKDLESVLKNSPHLRNQEFVNTFARQRGLSGKEIIAAGAKLNNLSSKDVSAIAKNQGVQTASLTFFAIAGVVLVFLGLFGKAVMTNSKQSLGVAKGNSKSECPEDMMINCYQGF